MICPFCKEEIKDGAIKCKHCGSMLNGSTIDKAKIDAPAQPKQSNISARVNQGALGCIIGGALMMVSPLLPWMTAVGGAFSATGFDKLGVQAFLIILFGLGILYGGIKSKSGSESSLPLVFSLISSVDAIILWGALNEQLETANIGGIEIGKIGIGFWIYLASVFISFVSSLYVSRLSKALGVIAVIIAVLFLIIGLSFLITGRLPVGLMLVGISILLIFLGINSRKTNTLDK